MIGFLTGRDDMEMFPQYQRAMDYGNKLYTKFRDEFGTVNCSEIQKLKFGRSYDLQNPEERENSTKRWRKKGRLSGYHPCRGQVNSRGHN